MTTKLHQSVIDSFVTAITADNAAGVLPEKVQAFMQQYAANYRARNIAAPKTTPKPFVPAKPGGKSAGTYGNQKRLDVIDRRTTLFDETLKDR